MYTEAYDTYESGLVFPKVNRPIMFDVMSF